MPQIRSLDIEVILEDLVERLNDDNSLRYGSVRFFHGDEIFYAGQLDSLKTWKQLTKLMDKKGLLTPLKDNFFATTELTELPFYIDEAVAVADYFTRLSKIGQKIRGSPPHIAADFQSEYFVTADKFMEYLNNLSLRIYVNLEPMNEKPVYKVTVGVKNGPIVLSDFVFDFGFFYYQLIL